MVGSYHYHANYWYNSVVAYILVQMGRHGRR